MALSPKAQDARDVRIRHKTAAGGRVPTPSKARRHLNLGTVPKLRCCKMALSPKAQDARDVRIRHKTAAGTR